MNIGQYVFGPQLPGIILCLVGLIMQSYPPKKINGWYGYRTASSMKDQETWDEANRYSAKVMVRVGALVFIAGIALTVAMYYLIADKKTVKGLMAGITLASAMIPAVTMIVMTEKHLDKTFNNKNEIR